MKELTDKDHVATTLPFTSVQQEAIVGHCLTDSIFFIKCKERIKPTWFTYSPMVSTVYDQLIKFYDSHNRPITSPEELVGESFFLEQTLADQEKYRNTVMTCLASTRHFQKDILKRYLTGFIRISMFKESMTKGSALFNLKGFDDAYLVTKEKLTEIEKATFEDDTMLISFKDPELWLNEDKNESINAISSGAKALDTALGGGFFPGDSTVVMAPTNSGKTTFMVTVARHAAFQGKKVLLITHEGRPKNIRRMNLLSMMAVTKQTSYQLLGAKSPLIKEAADYIDNHITYIHYSKAMGMYLEDVIEEIKIRNTSHKLKFGTGYDLIVNDYPAKLRSRSMGQQKAKKNEELAYIYDTFNLLAGELRSHILVAAQTNREGYKMNKNADEGDEYLDIDNLAESYGIGTNMPNMISLNRSPEDKRLEQLSVTVIKSRDTMTHSTFHTKTDFGKALTHGDANMFDRFNANALMPNGLPNFLKLDNAVMGSKQLSDILNGTAQDQNITSVNGSQFSPFMPTNV